MANPPPLSEPITPRFIIHGGAGNISRKNLTPPWEAKFKDALLEINTLTRQLLHEGCSALDAATHAVVQLENNDLFNAGKGAVFTRDGGIELESSVSEESLVVVVRWVQLALRISCVLTCSIGAG